MVIELTIPGKPFGKQRPRHNRYSGITYTPNETKEHERIIQKYYRAMYGEYIFPNDACVVIEINAYYPIPKATTKKRMALIESGKEYPTIKPDWDNIGKLVADALNGFAYEDDKCIIGATISKHYAVEFEPCVKIRLINVRGK